MANKDNPGKGALFEATVQRFLASTGTPVRKKFALEIGVEEVKRKHNFDLGSADPKVVVECKSHSWTEGGNAPSAKMAVWNEAMYYFSLVPDEYRKILSSCSAASTPTAKLSFSITSAGTATSFPVASKSGSSIRPKIPRSRCIRSDAKRSNQAMQLTASKLSVYAWGGSRRERMLRPMHRGLAAA